MSDTTTTTLPSGLTVHRTVEFSQGTARVSVRETEDDGRHVHFHYGNGFSFPVQFARDLAACLIAAADEAEKGKAVPVSGAKRFFMHDRELWCIDAKGFLWIKTTLPCEEFLQRSAMEIPAEEAEKIAAGKERR
jgi:hypothetical protein